MQNFVTGTRRVTHSQHLLITTASLPKRGQVYFVSSENEFYFHASKNTFRYERLRSKPYLEKEVKSILETG